MRTTPVRSAFITLRPVCSDIIRHPLVAASELDTCRAEVRHAPPRSIRIRILFAMRNHEKVDELKSLLRRHDCNRSPCQSVMVGHHAKLRLDPDQNVDLYADQKVFQASRAGQTGPRVDDAVTTRFPAWQSRPLRTEAVRGLQSRTLVAASRRSTATRLQERESSACPRPGRLVHVAVNNVRAVIR